MPILKERINNLTRLGEILKSNDEIINNTIQSAHAHNGWFTPNYVQLSLSNICNFFLQKSLLENWVENYTYIKQYDTLIQDQKPTVGLIMAGNIPLVGFHDFICLYISGLNGKLKLSSKDQVLWAFILEKMKEIDPQFSSQICIAENLKDCNAYIATGSNNSARYFEFYFNKYPNIIRKNRTSIAVLDGTETDDTLHLLSNDLSQYYGLGCRNVTQIYIPKNYNFEKLLQIIDSNDSNMDNHKYKNNYDYQLAILLLNKQKHFAANSLLLTESSEHFSPISVLHYQYYDNKGNLVQQLFNDNSIQCIVSNTSIPFGKSQQPSLSDYADRVDTMAFLGSLIKF